MNSAKNSTTRFNHEIKKKVKIKKQITPIITP